MPTSRVIHYAARHVMLRFIGSNRSFVDYFWPCYLVKNVISDSLIKIENLIEMAAYIIDMWRTLQLTAYAGKCYVFRFINKIEVSKLQNKTKFYKWFIIQIILLGVETNSHYVSKHVEHMLHPWFSFSNCGMASIHQINNIHYGIMEF